MSQEKIASNLVRKNISAGEWIYSSWDKGINLEYHVGMPRKQMPVSVWVKELEKVMKKIEKHSVNLWNVPKV